MTPDDPTKRPPYTYQRRGRWFWEPPPRLRGPSHKTVALGADQTTAWQVARQLNRQLVGDAAAAKGTVRWLFDQFEASTTFDAKADSTKKDYKWLGRLLSAHEVGSIPLGQIPAKAIRARHADKIYAELKTRSGDATAHYACRYARRVWKWGIRQEHLEENPWASMELTGLQARKQRWTRAQVETYMAKAVEKGWPSQALAAHLAWRLTLREQDILALTWTQIDKRLVDTRKTGAEVPIVTAAYPDLAKRLKATRRDAVQVVVCETTKAAWKEDYFRHVFREIADAAKIPKDLQFRDLRSTGLTELADAGADDIGHSSHAGHLTPEMRRRYVRRTPAQFEAAAKLRLKAEKKQ